MMLPFIPLAFEYDDFNQDLYLLRGVIFFAWFLKGRVLFCMQGVEFVFEKEGCMNGGSTGSF